MYNVRVIIITFALDQRNGICKVGRDSPRAVELEQSGSRRREEADSSGEELLTTEELMDTSRRSTMGREVCMLELAASLPLLTSVQSYLLEEDLLGGDWYHVVETSTAAAGKRRLLPL
ncbi:hypothetical protein H0E87_031175 [Populus deltoides]|uniref:Uncharacterized protein n=1 Tax=Populus deltoides TaxID=3696 RepID=A0A8T2WII9_POPDE|nr:hypothetical protein H0E87_031175 [Populus deltoides]